MMEKTVLKYLADDGVTWLPFTGDVPAPTASIVVKGVPIGDKDGTNKVFTTPQPYVAGTLQVYINGLAQSGFVTEVSPNTGGFSVDTAPLAGDDLAVYFHVANTGVGNADSLGGYQLSALLDTLFPVGCHWDGGESPNLPPLLASIGTWERFKGRVVVGVDEAQTEFEEAGKTGGAKTHTLTTAQLPSHTHPSSSGSNFVTDSGAGTNVNSASGGSYAFRLHSNVTGARGDGQAHNNLQPYEASYMWKRIA